MRYMQKRQQGFTLLELLVVITLLAVLAVGALVAYEGVGDQASAAAAANNLATADRAVRNYRAVTKAYPDQWDNLYVTGTQSQALLANETQAILSPVAEAGFGTALSAVLDALDAVGIEEVQNIVTNADLTTGVAPNLMHNEGANPNADEVAVAPGSVVGLAIVPDHDGTGACGGVSAKYSGTVTAADGQRLNKINDSLVTDECDLVIALGFGHDAAHSTTDSSVAIAQAPTYTSAKINPNTHYARYIGLFHVATDENGDQDYLDTDEVHEKAHFIGFIDPEGHVIDENIAAANANQ